MQHVTYLESEVFGVAVVSVKDQEPARNFLHWFDAAELGTLAVHFSAWVEGWDVPVAACADVHFLDLQLVRILKQSSIQLFSIVLESSLQSKQNHVTLRSC